MTPRPFSSASLLAGAALTLMTGLVFFWLQDYGPESALRRFHEAIVQRNSRTLSEVTLNPESEDTREAVAVVNSFLVQNGGHYRLMSTDRRGRWVGAEVLYIFPSGQTRSIFWVVKKKGDQWMVDPVETAQVVSIPRGRQSQS